MEQYLAVIDRAVTFLVPHVRDPNDSYRQARDKVRKRVMFAAARGEFRADQVMGGTPDQPLPTGTFIAWARKKWPSKLDAYPAEYCVDTGSKAMLSDAAYTVSYPPDVEQCHEILRASAKAIRVLTKQLMEAQNEITRLRPIEAQFDAWCRKNQKNAERRRKE
ncbi:MAG TPA: hypothetical protein VGH80_03320 [Xanthomonadaceae bacterium]|jgi:hypothetical protein